MLASIDDRSDAGHKDPLNLVVEIKGLRGEDAFAKAETMATQWVPGVNALGTCGRWAFARPRSRFRQTDPGLRGAPARADWRQDIVML